MSLRVGLTYNVKSEWVPKPGDPPDVNAEFDHEDTINHIENAFREAGYGVVRIGNARQLLEQVGKLDVDIIFNIAEGYEGRNRESQVPILLEMMRIPFVGADGLTLGLTLDKVLTKKVLIAEGIPTPRYLEVHDPDKFWEVDLTFPLIVKLRCEGSSKGLSEKSLVATPEELRRQVRWLTDTYKQSTIFIEEFIEGQEFTVAIVGNEEPETCPVVQIALDGVTDLGRKFFTFAYLRTGSDYLCPAPIPPTLAEKMQELALRTYRAVQCRDFGRVDFRVDRQGHPYVLEINPLPSLSTEDVFNYIAKTRGMTHYQVINRILNAALTRYGLKPRDEAGVLYTTRSH
ncbi:MAG: ATP-grasp domain-containing protein [Candidatus Omnitrophica bacterium]|nr:ATP-grasp domain-containing protein [Candidatus Omnitrophota bacterium]MBI2174883.1 ATP-grasp domain-containing protein [Candidatus Omnitrophota bacterium]MBI3009579.1 ATP-grasp domain-containing protein [Candidatus Omnitrophota bacterium]